MTTISNEISFENGTVNITAEENGDQCYYVVKYLENPTSEIEFDVNLNSEFTSVNDGMIRAVCAGQAIVDYGVEKAEEILEQMNQLDQMEITQEDIQNFTDQFSLDEYPSENSNTH